MAQPKQLMADWNTSVAQHWTSATSRTTSPDHFWNLVASDRNYTLDSEEPDYIGTIVNIIHDGIDISFFDHQGSEIISHPIPPKGTRYVGNGKPAGIAADPDAAVRKRIIRLVKTTTPTNQPEQETV